MDESDETESPEAACRADWDRRMPLELFAGEFTLRATTPSAPIGNRGFYVQGSMRPQGYVDRYNAELDRLLDTYGCPKWAPVNRVPSKEVARTFLARARPLRELTFPSKRQRWSVRNAARLRNPGPDFDATVLAFADEVDERVFLFVPLDDGSTRAVVVDTIIDAVMIEFPV